MAEVLTEKRRQILDFIIAFQREHGYPPSVREIGRSVGLASSATVHDHIDRLAEGGFLVKDPTKPRALQVRYEPASRTAVTAERVRNVPLIGEVAAGTDLIAEQHLEEVLPLPERFAGTEESFMLRVRGDSMIEAGILDGDVVVVRRAQDARDGEIVVALAGDDETADEATVKRFFREDGRIRLQPENSALEPIYASHVEILGKVVGVFREL
jgi:repressor LexA